MPTVPVTLRLTRAQLETAQRLAGKSGIRYQTLLKKLIGDGLRSLERAARLKNWR
jgi:predicted DNA binding CopG/RHH family protein